MMRKMAFVITLFILVVSVIGVFSVTRSMIARYSLMTLLQGPLCIIGILSFILFIFKKNLYALLNVIWFLPQVVVLAERYVDPVYDAYVERGIYDLTIIVNSVIVFSVEKATDVYLRIGFNFIGIAGLILSILILVYVCRHPAEVVEKPKRQIKQTEPT
jgi:hypothetical protein